MGAKSSVFAFCRMATSAYVALATLGLSAPSVAAVGIEWVTVGDPGNAADTTGFGAVDYVYQIGKFQVTTAEYAEFLNAVDPTGANALGLYNSRLGSEPTFGGIGFFEVNPPGLHYYVFGGHGDVPVVFFSFFDALRFANWLHNGQGGGDTETGSYTLLGGTPVPSNSDTVSRTLDSTVVLPSEDEWYKAAYYDALKQPQPGYFNYPTGTDGQIVCEPPPGADNSANCDKAVGTNGERTDVGAYTSSPSPWGTFDQGGNVSEWNEAIVGSHRAVRGGSWFSRATNLGASARGSVGPVVEGADLGFRVVRLPEPDAWLLGVVALATVVGLTRLRRKPQP